MTWLTGHAHTFTQMAWTRGLMGVSEAVYIPAALALIAEFLLAWCSPFVRRQLYSGEC
ncbi:MAG: dgoT [Pedosphaera sp.]|nr:dgoT [Pedosphaera sp.]